jgi:hypothetical protein
MTTMHPWEEILRLTRERDAARAAIRDASRCEDCGAWATRYHTASARFACDSCAPGDGWADDPHAAAPVSYTHLTLPTKLL